MKTIKTLAAAAALGALSLSAVPAAAGFHGGGHGSGFHGGRHWGHHGGYWGHRGYGWGYGYGIAAYVPDCYYVRRFGALIKVCE